MSPTGAASSRRVGAPGRPGAPRRLGRTDPAAGDTFVGARPTAPFAPLLPETPMRCILRPAFIALAVVALPALALGQLFPGQHLLVGNGPTGVAVGDVNQDGLLDYVTSDGGSNAVSVLFGNGNGGSLPRISFPVGTSPSGVALGDLDGNGKVDIATSNEGSNNVSVLFGTGNGNFTTPFNFNVGAGPKAIAISDLNVDGKLDIVTANVGG